MRKSGYAAPRTPHRPSAFFCSVLTAYGLWPGSQALAADAPLSLRLAPAIDRAVGAYTHVGEPVELRMSYETGALPAPTREPVPPLPLQMAMVLREAPAASALEDDLKRIAEPARAQPVFYEVRVNGQPFGVARLLRRPDGSWFARRADLEQWRLRLPEGEPLTYEQEEHYPLDAYAGIAYRFNDPLQALDIDVSPRYFSTTVLESARRAAAAPSPPPPGGFLNYDLFFNANAGVQRLDGQFEGAVFNRYGVGVSGLLARDVGSERDFVRLETAWRRDFVSGMKSLIIGDAIGSSGSWGRPVRFGGVRYGTNFATNPGFVTFPLPTLAGEAALPTTTELYIDGVLRQSGQVPPGPFRIDNVPVVTGRGEVRLVVRDLLGREQVIAVPYYASTRLLREGLVEESYELGAVRENFGIRSHDYGRALAAGQWRKGYSDQLTAEARAELLRDQQTAGAGASYILPDYGVVSGAAAVSRGPHGTGALILAGFERQAWQGMSFGLRSQWTSEDFTQLGLQPGQRAPARLLSGNLGYSAGGWGSVGMAYIRQDNRDFPSIDIASASYSLTLGRSSSLILYASKPLNGAGSYSFGATLALGFTGRGSGSVNVTTQPGATEATAQFQQNLPPGTGAGYRLLAGGGTRGARQEAGFAYQSDFGTYLVEAGRADGRTGVRASASGGVAVIGDRVFMARTIDQSFGVAHVEGFPDVGIYVNNQVIARTDREGYALLPRLLPYQPNAVRIDSADLPLDTRIAAMELAAVPYFRSGLLLRFPVEKANSAVLVVRQEDGSPVPVGALVNLAGQEEAFPVAQRGEVYVTGLGERNRLEARWDDKKCGFEVEPGAALGSQPRLGPMTCRSAAR